MTKRLAAILAVCCWIHGTVGSVAHAAAPEILSYQGVLVQDSGIAVQNGVYNLRFRLYDQQTLGTVLFEQTLSTQVTHGLYNVILSNNDGYELGDIVNQNPQLFMEVTVEANPALGVPSDMTLLPRQQLASVPYALTQAASGSLEGDTKRLATPTSVDAVAGVWQIVPALEGLSLNVSGSGCSVEVQSAVVIGGDRTVGVRLEQSIGGGAFSPVRGPVVGRATQAASPETLFLSYLLVDPPAGTLTFRVTSQEVGNNEWTVSPSINDVGQTESTLSGAVFCP